jgi:hypothetical protein
MALSERAQSALGWAFGSILGAAYEGLGTSDIWNSLKDAAQSQGLETVGLSATDVSQLRSYASQIVQASDNLASADPALGLENNMIGYAPWSMDANTLALAPEYWARVEMTVADEQGNMSTGWFTMTGINSLDMTAGDLNQLVQLNAEAAATGEGASGTPRGSLVSTGRVELVVAPQA